MGLGAPLYDMTMDGKVGTLKPVEGLKDAMYARKDTWQFKEYNKDLDNIWWDGMSGSWQNAVAPSHPDPIAGNHAWHQKVRIEKAAPTDKIGDIWVNYENVTIAQRVMADALFVDGKKGEESIRRVTVPLVALLMDDEVIYQLHAQSLS